MITYIYNLEYYIKSGMNGMSLIINQAHGIVIAENYLNAVKILQERYLDIGEVTLTELAPNNSYEYLKEY